MKLAQGRKKLSFPASPSFVVAGRGGMSRFKDLSSLLRSNRTYAAFSSPGPESDPPRLMNIPNVRSRATGAPGVKLNPAFALRTFHLCGNPPEVKGH